MTARLVAVVHLGPLPGSPRFGGAFEAVLERAVADAQVLQEAGFDALVIENYGDAPYFADDVPDVTVAAMARAVATTKAAVGDFPLGVNVLRNDALAALSVAVACEADFIRVNVLTGTMYTDQGIIQGRAAEVARTRAALGREIEVLADVLVKHAVPPPEVDLEQAARDAYQRGLANGLVITGDATGRAPDPSRVEALRRALPEVPLLVGSGVDKDNVGRFLDISDGVIVGTDVKEDGITDNPVDPGRATVFVREARKALSSS